MNNTQSSQLMYASLFKRFLAFLIDSVNIGIVALILVVPVVVVTSLSGSASTSVGDGQLNSNDYGLGTVAALIDFIVTWLYYALGESSNQQSTLGKRVLGIKVVRPDGKKLSFARASVRIFVKLFELSFTFLLFIFAFFSSKKQTIHDKVVDTYVVNNF